jgi:hypothetical protein
MENVMVTAVGQLISTDLEVGTRKNGARFPMSKAKAQQYREQGLVMFDEDIKESKKAVPESQKTTESTDLNAGGSAQQSTSLPAAPASKPAIPKLSNEEKKKLAQEKKAAALAKQTKNKKA